MVRNCRGLHAENGSPNENPRRFCRFGCCRSHQPTLGEAGWVGLIRRGRGEIGRRAGFRFPWPKGLAGSSPVARIGALSHGLREGSVLFAVSVSWDWLACADHNICAAIDRRIGQLLGGFLRAKRVGPPATTLASRTFLVLPVGLAQKHDVHAPDDDRFSMLTRLGRVDEVSPHHVPPGMVVVG